MASKIGLAGLVLGTILTFTGMSQCGKNSQNISKYSEEKINQIYLNKDQEENQRNISKGYAGFANGLTLVGLGLGVTIAGFVLTLSTARKQDQKTKELGSAYQGVRTWHELNVRTGRYD